MIQSREEAVKDIIECLYKAKYTAEIKVETLTNSDGNITGYLLILGLNNSEMPLQIAFDGDWDSFLKYIKEELRTRRLSDTEYFFGEKFYIQRHETR